MPRQTDIHGALSRRIEVGPGTIVEIRAVDGQLAQQLKLIAGGTLEIGGGATAQQANASLGYGTTFGELYPLSANEIYSWNNAGSLYLWASGTTCVVALINGRTAGNWSEPGFST